jgi:hypothetical protein
LLGEKYLRFFERALTWMGLIKSWRTVAAGIAKTRRRYRRLRCAKKKKKKKKSRERERREKEKKVVGGSGERVRKREMR